MAKTKRHFNGYNFLVCWLVSLGQLAFGYPASIIGTTLAQPPFLVYMNLIESPNAAQLIGTTSGIFQAGAFINVLFTSHVSDKWGRKAALIWCAILSIVGGAMLCGSQNITMFIVARFIAGGGSWGFLAVTPAYSAELAPPDLRGLMVGLNGINIALGYGLASYMGLAFFYIDDPVSQWRSPLGIALIWPFLMIGICFIVPESPRFLLMKGRVAEAKKIVLKLHSVKGDPDNEFAESEFYQMSKQAEIDRKLDPGYLELFRRPSYRRRCLLAMGFAFLGQSTGVLVLNNYGPRIYGALGYDTEYQLIFQCGWISVGILFNAVGAAIMDWTGRKPLLMIGLGGCCASLIIEAAIVATYAETGSTNQAGLRTGVAAAYIFLAFYSVGVDVAGVVFYSELFPNHIRAKGISLSIAAIALTDLVYLQATESAFRNIGYKFYLIFIILSGIGVIFTYFFIPETKGIPLEEMSALFGDTDDIAVYATDIHLDHTTHEVYVDEHGQSQVRRIDTTETTSHVNGTKTNGHLSEKEGRSAKHVDEV